MAAVIASPTAMFQFTPLREGRLCLQEKKPCSTCFNSRPCVRGDFFGYTFSGSNLWFQFTPLREGRRGTRSLGTISM